VYWTKRRFYLAARIILGKTFSREGAGEQAAVELQAVLNILNISFYANRCARPSNALTIRLACFDLALHRRNFQLPESGPSLSLPAQQHLGALVCSNILIL
jgi:hypothetical protein